MTVTEAVTETVKDALGMGAREQAREQPLATREQMSEARLPIQYRDSCAHLLIPLNRCRVNEYYLPWKCQVLPNPTH
ncbi:MAG: hypothetical protein Q9208_008793 [Pyrenodesmia sp. 3 TL-2023]